MACTCSLRNKQYKTNGRFLREAAFNMPVTRTDYTEEKCIIFCEKVHKNNQKIFANPL